MKSTYIKSTYVNQPITVENKVASIDSSYGPYKTIQEALNSIPYKYRALGRTVAIIEDNEVKEYQWKSGIEDSDLVEKYSGGEPTEPITWNTLGGKPTIIASGETEEEARNSIGAGTGNSNLVLGTTATTAKAGNYQPTWAQVTSKPAVIASGTTQAEARTAIGAGTSNLTVGTGATNAKAGNYQPTVANISDASTIGRSILTANDATAVRTAIGAGTGNSNLAIGTTSTTAMAGDTPLLTIGTTASTAKAGNYVPTWSEVTSKPATFPPTIGTTAATAKAGNYTPSATEVVTALNAMTPEQIEEIQLLLGITP